jgi:hypothetical protein
MFVIWPILTLLILCYAELSFMPSHTVNEAWFMPRYTMSKHCCSFQFQYHASFSDLNLKQASEKKISRELRYSQSFCKQLLYFLVPWVEQSASLLENCMHFWNTRRKYLGTAYIIVCKDRCINESFHFISGCMIWKADLDHYCCVN